MKMAMISQPMRGLSDDEIKATRDRAVECLSAKGYEVVNTLFDFSAELDEDGIEQKALYYLARSLESMSRCHAVYFCNGWSETRGCKIEHEAATAYGLDIIYEED